MDDPERKNPKTPEEIKSIKELEKKFYEISTPTEGSMRMTKSTPYSSMRPLYEWWAREQNDEILESLRGKYPAPSWEWSVDDELDIEGRNGDYRIQVQRDVDGGLNVYADWDDKYETCISQVSKDLVDRAAELCMAAVAFLKTFEREDGEEDGPED